MIASRRSTVPLLLALTVSAACSLRAPRPESPAASPRQEPAKPMDAPAAPPSAPVVTQAAQPAKPAPPANTVSAPAPPAAPGTPAPASPPASTPGKSQGAPSPESGSAYVFSPSQSVSARPQTPTPGSAPSGASADAAGAKGQPAPSTPSTPPPAGALQLVLVASAQELAPGDILTLDVIASSQTEIVDAPLHLSFDPRVMAYVDGVPGDFLTQGGSSVVFLSDGLSRPGDIAVAAGRTERTQGATGGGLLCRVRLRGVASGVTPIVVGSAKAWGAKGELLDVVSTGTSAVVR